MDQNAQQDTGLTAVMERALQPLMAECSALPATGMRTTTSGPVLSWGAVAFGRESVLPEATVTWTGHGRVDVTQRRGPRRLRRPRMVVPTVREAVSWLRMAGWSVVAGWSVQMLLWWGSVSCPSGPGWSMCWRVWR